MPYRPTERIIVGTVEATRPDTLVLDTADTWRERRSLFPSAVRVDEFRHIHLPLSTVDSVEVSRGRSRFLGALKGGTQGAVVAGIVVGLASISGHSNPRFADFTTGLSAGAIAGTVIGVPIGYLFGVERWRTVHLPKRNHTPRLATAGGSAGTPTP